MRRRLMLLIFLAGWVMWTAVALRDHRKFCEFRTTGGGERSFRGHGIWIGSGGGELIDSTSKLGVHFLRFQTPNRPADTSWLLIVPYWPLSIVTLPLLWIWVGREFRRSRGERRIRRGLCAACGYDLRATAKRCPECGMVAAKEAAKSVT